MEKKRQRFDSSPVDVTIPASNRSNGTFYDHSTMNELDDHYSNLDTSYNRYAETAYGISATSEYYNSSSSNGDLLTPSAYKSRNESMPSQQQDKQTNPDQVFRVRAPWLQMVFFPKETIDQTKISQNDSLFNSIANHILPIEAIVEAEVYQNVSFNYAFLE
jgi:hypothetical protein